MTNAEKQAQWRLNNPERWKQILYKYINKVKKTEKYINIHKKYHEIYMFGIRRDIILSRDKYTCQYCGTKSVKLEIHHIDGNGTTKIREERNNDPKNLITLCRSCHKKADRKLRLIKNGLIGDWSDEFERCIKCGKTDSKHVARGVCNRCYSLNRREYKKQYWRDHYGKKNTKKHYN